MFRYHRYKPLRKGVSLIELVIGLAVMSIISLIIGGIFLVATKSYHTSLRKTAILSNARKAVAGDGDQRGLILGIQEAQSFTNLLTDALHMTSRSGSPVEYTVLNDTLYQAEFSLPKEQAEGITRLQISYYHMDSLGLIVESSDSASAVFSTVMLNMKGKADQKSYDFFSGAGLRNSP